MSLFEMLKTRIGHSACITIRLQEVRPRLADAGLALWPCAGVLNAGRRWRTLARMHGTGLQALENKQECGL